ncbi:hypothetical protein BWP39_30480 [Paraburkholderia acidicola]|uniref:Uncharacterized protein n=1 Tax=Paraburkholderia acidicola TaxID=1912599 RepID=A0A2A4EUA3_9BURK|nr:hypothetical protein [Paraburkholderia acidicola]PCE24012.1 hypothetical protein BWP39_30480 [Paraburkholderia acidicola]
MNSYLSGQRRFCATVFYSITILMSCISAACITACALDLLPDALGGDALAVAVLAILTAVIFCPLHLLPASEVEWHSPETFVRKGRLRCEQFALQGAGDLHGKPMLHQPIITRANWGSRLLSRPLPLMVGSELSQYLSLGYQPSGARSGRIN